MLGIHSIQLRLVDLLNPNNPTPLDTLVLLITFLGDWKFLALIGVAIFLRDRKLGTGLLVALLLTTAIIYPLKFLINEPRPWVDHSEIRAPPAAGTLSFLIGYEEPLDSFPSGHAAFSFAYFMVLSKKKKYQVFFLMAAILISLTRLYLGQHYPLDIVAGAIIGIVTGFSAARFYIVNVGDR